MSSSSDAAPAIPETGRPQVSVVCAWYNRAAYLRTTLDSLLAQTHDAYEIVVVNDGSPDPQVREILESYDDPRLTVIHQDNAGFPTAIRRAISVSRGEYLAIQGAGDISFPSRLARQAAFLDAHPDYAAVGCTYNNLLVRKGDVDPNVPDTKPGYDGSAADAGTLKTEVTPEMLLDRNPFSHGEVMIRRSAYDAVGGYRIFFTNSQDKDLWLRLIERDKLGVLADWLYQRHAFVVDGIATDLRKLLTQTAYSLIAEKCWRQRKAGGTDDVARYDKLALMRVPMTLRTRRRILRSVKQADYYGTLDPAELAVVRDLYGPLNHALARGLLSWLRIRRR